MVFVTIPIRRLLRGLYRLCQCGCGTLIPCLTKNSISKYKIGHSNKNKRGENAPHWIGGRVKSGLYWYLKMPEDIHSKKDGYVAEHVYFYTQYHKCCMLFWGVVHHIDPVREGYCNNMVWNLMGLTNRQHASMHKKGNTYGKNKKVDMSSRRCSKCGTDKTYIKREKYSSWHRDGKGGFLCYLCYAKKIYNIIHNKIV